MQERNIESKIEGHKKVLQERNLVISQVIMDSLEFRKTDKGWIFCPFPNMKIDTEHLEEINFRINYLNEKYK